MKKCEDCTFMYNVDGTYNRKSHCILFGLRCHSVRTCGSQSHGIPLLERIERLEKKME